jgi:hypothetical protein
MSESICVGIFHLDDSCADLMQIPYFFWRASLADNRANFCPLFDQRSRYSLAESAGRTGKYNRIGHVVAARMREVRLAATPISISV